MSGDERAQLLALVPHLRRISGRAGALLEHVKMLRQAAAEIARDLTMLEEETRQLAHVAGLVEGLLEWIEDGQE